MKLCNLLLLFLVFCQGEPVDMYYRGGDEAVLPCNRPSSSDSCSSVDWFHKRNENINIQQEVHRGIVQSSPRSARMSLDRNCSLIINNINADDVGRYRCTGRKRTRVFDPVVLIVSCLNSADLNQFLISRTLRIRPVGPEASPAFMDLSRKVSGSS
uniref:Ig-like domain-containing protein n=1 Tax=Poecilia latipinna TaxID=48699 RepID=A0A3B3TIH7_9TELE